MPHVDGALYHDHNHCSACSGQNMINRVVEPYSGELSTKCSECGYVDTWAYGYYCKGHSSNPVYYYYYNKDGEYCVFRRKRLLSELFSIPYRRYKYRLTRRVKRLFNIIY